MLKTSRRHALPSISSPPLAWVFLQRACETGLSKLHPNQLPCQNQKAIPIQTACHHIHPTHPAHAPVRAPEHLFAAGEILDLARSVAHTREVDHRHQDLANVTGHTPQIRGHDLLLLVRGITRPAGHHPLHPVGGVTRQAVPQFHDLLHQGAAGILRALLSLHPQHLGAVEILGALGLAAVIHGLLCAGVEIQSRYLGPRPDGDVILEMLA